MAAADRADLADLLTLEADARDERVRDLATRLVERGIDEARRRLEQVAHLDAQLQDLRELIARLADDGGRNDVVAPHNRFMRALGGTGRALVEQALDGAGDLERLALLWRGLAAPVPVLPDPESAWSRPGGPGGSGPAAALVLPADRRSPGPGGPGRGAGRGRARAPALGAAGRDGAGRERRAGPAGGRDRGDGSW